MADQLGNFNISCQVQWRTTSATLLICKSIRSCHFSKEDRHICLCLPPKNSFISRPKCFIFRKTSGLRIAGLGVWIGDWEARLGGKCELRGLRIKMPVYYLIRQGCLSASIEDDEVGGSPQVASDHASRGSISEPVV